MIWSMQLQNYDKHSHAMLAIFYTQFRKKKSPSVNKLNCTLNTTTSTARTAHRYELVQSLLQLYQKNQLSLVHYLETVKNEVFSANTVFVITYISFLLWIYFT